MNKGYCDFMYMYKAKSFVGNQGLHAFDKLKDNISFFLYNEVKLNDNKIELWVNNNLKKIYKKLFKNVYRNNRKCGFYKKYL